MNEMIVLIDYVDQEGYVKGMIADMGSDLLVIGEQIRMMEASYHTMGMKYLGAYILSVETERPTKPYIPNNGFKMTYGDDMATNHPVLGKVWTTLVARFEPGSFEEE